MKAKLKHLDKISEPPNDAMARGAEIHDQARDYIKGLLKRMPESLKKFALLFKHLRKLHAADLAFVEQDWSFTKEWGPTTWDDWNGCHVRIKLDAAYRDGKCLYVIDWKTGRFRSSEAETTYREQLELYALAALLLYPQIEMVRPQLVYLDAETKHPDPPLTYNHKDVEALKKNWLKRVRPLLNDKRFAPRPNDFCRWCFYRASNKLSGGGQCKY